MKTFCAATGLRIFSKPEWSDHKLSDTCAMTFSVMGNSILYSAPKGKFDLTGIQNAIQLKNEVKQDLAEGSGPYFQILDYSDLKGSAQATRKIFIRDLNDDKRLRALIFCNMSLPLFTAVKIGQQFIKGKTVHLVSHYVDAVKLALTFCQRHNLDQDIQTAEPRFFFDSSGYSHRQVELHAADDWDIHVPGFSNRTAIIDNCILYSKSEGYLEYEHLEAVGQLRQKCQAALPQEDSLQYIVVDASKLKGMSRKARMNYMTSLKKWHQHLPFRMYIVFGANKFMNTVIHLAGQLMPFTIRIAQDFNQAVDIIRRDKLEKSGRKQIWQKDEDTIEPADANIKKMLAFIASLNWERAGVEDRYLVDEQHPFNILFHSIKLIKEEFDSLLNEQKQLTVSLEAREQLLGKQTKELIASNESLKNEIAVRKLAEKALKESQAKLEQSATSLKDSNIALKVLLKQREQDKKEIEEKVLLNVEKLILPYLEKLKERSTQFAENAFVEIVESNLKEIISPFSHSLSRNLQKLTRAEMQVADLVRQGKTTKEIAELLGLSPATVATHRQKIRKKLALTNKKINLQANLQQIQTN